MFSQYLGGKKLPDAPGVYFFLGTRRKMLYIGRATSLRSRVRSYFDGRLAETRGPWLARVLKEVRRIDWRETDSVLEAILVEAELIKKFQPPYNAREKDDKSFTCIAITDEPFPRVLLVRKHDVDSSALEAKSYKLKTVYGPFPYGLKLKEAMKIIRRIFPWRDSKCIPLPEQKKRHRLYSSILQNTEAARPCFGRQIGLCPGVCTGEMGQKEYQKHIKRLQLFLSGKKGAILRELEREMRRAAKTEQFEKAGEYKRMLFALKHIQDVALLKRDADSASVLRSRSASVSRPFRIEGYDLSHFGGKEIVGAMSVVENGRAVPSEYRLFRIRGLRGAHEPAGLQEIIRRRLAHSEWPLPSLIAVDGGVIQKRSAEAAIRSAGFSISVVAVVKDEKHRPREILGVFTGELRSAILFANSEAHRFALKFQRKRRVRAFSARYGHK